MKLPYVLLGSLLIGCSEYDIQSIPNTPGTPGDEDGSGEDGNGNPVVDGETGDITGRICSPSEASYVVGARVWVELSDGQVVETTTDGDGFFTLRGVPVGTQTVNVQKGSFYTNFDVLVTEGVVTELAEEECLRNDLAVAVVTGDFDHIESLLADLAIEYDAYSNPEVLLQNPSRLSGYDIVFFNCGMDDMWAYSSLNTVGNNVRDYIASGGSIYTSDWAYYVVEASLPEMVTFIGPDHTPGSAYTGMAGSVTAEVLSSNLTALLGKDTAQINYDLDYWAVAERIDQGTPLLRANVDYMDPSDPWGLTIANRKSPLAVIMEYGNGKALYTSFHNEQQITGDMLLILEDFILSL